MTNSTIETDESDFRVADFDSRIAEELPQEIITNLEGYLNRGDEPSAFLRAALGNRLSEAIETAPEGMTLAKLHSFNRFIDKCVPMEAKHGINGYLEEQGGRQRRIAEAAPVHLIPDHQREARVLWGYLKTQRIEAEKELRRARPEVQKAIIAALSQIALEHERLQKKNPFAEPTETH